jgi:hypothetical protein
MTANLLLFRQKCGRIQTSDPTYFKLSVTVKTEFSRPCEFYSRSKTIYMQAPGFSTYIVTLVLIPLLHTDADGRCAVLINHI